MRKPLKASRGSYQTGQTIRQHALRQWRWKRKMTIDALAKQVGVRPPTISKIETWGYYPGLQLVAKLRALTGISANRFLPPDDTGAGSKP